MSAPELRRFDGDPAAPPAAPIRDALLPPPLVAPARGKLGEPRRRVAWRAPLSIAPARVQAGGGAVLAHSPSEWQLFGDDGRVRGRGPCLSGGAAIDVARRVFFVGTRFGGVAARALDDGAERFEVSPYFGAGYDRALIDLVDGKLLVVSVERHIGGGPPPRTSLVELHGNDGTGEIDRITELVIAAAPMLAAHAGTRVAIGGRGWVAMVALPALTVQSLATGEFSLEALALDAGESALAVVQTRDGRAIWQITARGERGLSLPLEEPGLPFTDGVRVMVLGRRALRVFDLRDEKRSWVRPLLESPAGAAASSDGWLLVAEGAQLRAFDRDGVGRPLHHASAPIVAPPLLLEDGRILLATRSDLLCLAP